MNSNASIVVEGERPQLQAPIIQVSGALPEAMLSMLDQRAARLGSVVARLISIAKADGDVAVISMLEGVTKLLEGYESCARRKPCRTAGLPARRAGG